MKQITVPYKNYKIQTYVNGQGTYPLVLLHGSGLDSAALTWGETLPYLEDFFTIYTIDLLGYGNSGSPPNLCGTSFYQEHISAVSEVISFFGLKNIILGGFSMGGAIAIGYTLAYSNHIAGLVLIDTWGLAEKLSFHKFCYWYMTKTDLTSWSYRLMAKSKFLTKWSIHYNLIGDKKKITTALIKTMMHLCTSIRAVHSMEDYQKSSITPNGVIPNYREPFTHLKNSVLFINGEKDPLVSAKTISAISNGMANSQIHIMNGCKHWTPKENPKELSNQIKNFSAKIFSS